MRGKPHAAFEAAGAGNVAWSKCWDTRNRKGEQQGIQTSTYTGAPVLDPTKNPGTLLQVPEGPLNEQVEQGARASGRPCAAVPCCGCAACS